MMPIMDAKKPKSISFPSCPTGYRALHDGVGDRCLYGGQDTTEARFEPPSVIINVGPAEKSGLEAIVLPPRIGDIGHLHTPFRSCWPVTS